VLAPGQSVSRDFVAGVSARLGSDLPSKSPQAAPVVIVRGNAANDTVFRWKMVAGLASLAAVAAVGWSMVGPGGVQGPAGPQMAMLPPSPVVAETTQPVTVETPQGPMVRDARLEELLAEHRQFGGMSALQMPAGFLRNATYDAAPQR
jgi:sigma-E factor negative regulatory protein RseA